MKTEEQKDPKGSNLSNTAKEKAVKTETRNIMGEDLIAGELLKASPSEKLLVIREDNAQIVYERQKFATIAGIMDTPLRYLNKRVELIDQLASHLIVNRDSMILIMTIHEEDHFKHTLKGALEVHPDFKKWTINTGVSWQPNELGDFIKMNRSYFDHIDTAMKLVTIFKTYKANVAKNFERVENQNGDRKILTEQYVQSNLPPAFDLILPLFKGYKPVKINIEVYISPNDLSVTLVSPEANELLQRIKDDAIDEQINQIRQVAPDLLITEE